MSSRAPILPAKVWIWPPWSLPPSTPTRCPGRRLGRRGRDRSTAPRTPTTTCSSSCTTTERCWGTSPTPRPRSPPWGRPTRRSTWSASSSQTTPWRWVPILEDNACPRCATCATTLSQKEPEPFPNSSKGSDFRRSGISFHLEGNSYQRHLLGVPTLTPSLPWERRHNRNYKILKNCGICFDPGGNMSKDNTFRTIMLLKTSWSAARWTSLGERCQVRFFSKPDFSSQWLVGLLVGWFVCWLVVWLLVGWLVGWLVG